MNIKKLIMLSVFVGSFAGTAQTQTTGAQFHAAAQDLPVVAHISQDNVEAARKAYQEETAWVFPVWTGIATGTVAAAWVGYQAYKYWCGIECLPNLEALTREVMEVKQRCLINSNNLDRLAQGQQLAAPQPAWYSRTSTGLWNATTSLFYSGVASAFVVTPVVNKLLEIKRALPNSGDLKWYLAERTGYNRNIVDLVQYGQHEVHRKTFTTVLHLFVGDIEKFLGYMLLFKESLDFGFYKQRCDDYCDDVARMTNKLVESTNRAESMDALMQLVSDIKLTIASAQHFVAQNS